MANEEIPNLKSFDDDALDRAFAALEGCRRGRYAAGA